MQFFFGLVHVSNIAQIKLVDFDLKQTILYFRICEPTPKTADLSLKARQLEG